MYHVLRRKKCPPLKVHTLFFSINVQNMLLLEFLLEAARSEFFFLFWEFFSLLWYFFSVFLSSLKTATPSPLYTFENIHFIDMCWKIVYCAARGKKFHFTSVIVYYVPRHTMRVIAWRATMFAGDRSQGVVEA